MYPDCPAPVRLGIGLCRYKLGQFEKARQAFERVLQVSDFFFYQLVGQPLCDFAGANGCLLHDFILNS